MIISVLLVIVVCVHCQNLLYDIFSTAGDFGECVHCQNLLYDIFSTAGDCGECVHCQKEEHQDAHSGQVRNVKFRITFAKFYQNLFLNIFYRDFF